MKLAILILFLCNVCVFGIKAQHEVSGSLVDMKGEPVKYATVALLYPSDSTLAFFAISDELGKFTLTQVVTGRYLLQCSRMGFKTLWRELNIPIDTPRGLGDLLMEEISTELGEVEVVDEHTPFRMRGDTLEYNSAAYRTGPDDVVEDLLEQLPGINVDEAGNIKAQGENVDKVLVDGKEFFGSDPKVATRNLPADAIKKVEVYDDLSDEAELTGMKDGQYDKTINLMLKENAKSAWIGEVKGGYGTGDHYTADAKAYWFTNKIQFAGLGMINNINKFGFTLQDYIDFQGGFQNFMTGSGSMEIELGESDEMPVDFGQPVNGLVTSGAGGLNYSYEKVKNNRLNVSYMLSGADKDLNQLVYTENNIPENYYYTNQLSDETNGNRSHLFNASWRAPVDSTGKFNVSVKGGLTDLDNLVSSSLLSYDIESIVNGLKRSEESTTLGKRINSNLSFLKKIGNKDQLFKLSASVSARENSAEQSWNNQTTYYNPLVETGEISSRDELTNQVKSEIGTSLTFSLGEKFSLQPTLTAGMDRQSISRIVWNQYPTDVLVDSLSGDYLLSYNWITPGIKFRKNTNKKNFVVGVGLENGVLDDVLNGDSRTKESYKYVLPFINWNNEYKAGRNLSFDYNTDVTTPGVLYRMPVADYSVGLQRSTGNRELQPEYSHSGVLRWMIFDQFSFTSFFCNLNARYTTNRMSWSTIIRDDLSVWDEPVNVPEASRVGVSAQFSTPIRKLGITLTLSGDESWRKSSNYMNGVSNTYSMLVHEFSFKIENRKKDKVRAHVSTGLTRSESLNAQASTGSYNWNQYFVTGGIKYTPIKNLSFECNVKWNHFDDATFRRAIDVPMLGAQVSWSGVRGGRGTFAIEAFDILDRNTGIKRTADLSFLRETRSDIIRQYVLFSFKYRLNKFAKEGGLEIEME